MNKKAFILIGKHYSGKSETLRYFKKNILNIDNNKKIFNFNNKQGIVLSQSSEECKRKPSSLVSQYGKYFYLILAGRPKDEKNSLTLGVMRELEKSDYKVKTLQKISNDGKEKELSNEIFKFLNSDDEK